MSLSPHLYVRNDPKKDQLLNFLTLTLWINPDPHLSLPRVLKRIVTQYGAKTALMEKVGHDYRKLTFHDISEQAVFVAAGFTDMGLPPGGRVAILLRNCINWVLCDFGVMSAGAITVPIYRSLTPEATEHILKDSGSEIVLVEDKKQFDKIAKIRRNLPALKYIIVNQIDDIPLDETVISFEDFLSRGQDKHLSWADEIERRTERLSRDDVASIVYTSGTTGFPKGVMLTHLNFLSTVYGTISVTDYNRYDRLLSILPLSHVFERIIGYYAALLSGSTIAYAEGIENMARNFQEFQPTMCAAVPRIFERLHMKIRDEIAKSFPLKRKIFEWSQSVGEEVWQLWQENLIEQCQHRSERLRHRAEDEPVQPVSWLDHPILFTKLRLARRLVFNKIRARFGGKIRYFIAGGAHLPQDVSTFFRKLNIIIYEGYGLTETSPIISFNYGNSYKENTVGKLIAHINLKFSPEGEILVKGPNVMKGYWNQPEATKAVIDEEGWFHTGDIGELDEEKYLKITGRSKDLIVLNSGKNVAPIPIEQKLTQSKLIANALVIGNDQKYISALIFPDLHELKNLAKDNSLPKQMFNDLTHHETILKTFSRIVKKVNESFSDFEQIRRFELIPYNVADDDDLITPTLKLKRKNLENKFADAIARLYPHT